MIIDRKSPPKKARHNLHITRCDSLCMLTRLFENISGRVGRPTVKAIRAAVDAIHAIGDRLRVAESACVRANSLPAVCGCLLRTDANNLPAVRGCLLRVFVLDVGGVLALLTFFLFNLGNKTQEFEANNHEEHIDIFCSIQTMFTRIKIRGEILSSSNTL